MAFTGEIGESAVSWGRPMESADGLLRSVGRGTGSSSSTLILEACFCASKSMTAA